MVLVATAVTIVTLGGTFAGVSFTFNRQQQEQLDAELRLVAHDEAREATAHAFSFTDRPGPAANDVGPLTKHGIIFDEAGSVLAATPPFDHEPPSRRTFSKAPLSCFDFRWKESHFRAVIVPIPGSPGRELLLAAPRDDLDGDERFLNRAMAIAFAAALLWVIAVTNWGVGKLTRDHDRITKVARQVAGGDFSARIGRFSTDDEMAQLGTDIDEMIVKIEALLGARDRLVAHAAHELRSPLTRLYGELQQAVRKERDAAGYREAIDRALPAAKHLTTLVDDLLLVARLRGERAPAQERVDIAQSVAEAVSLAREEADAKGVRLVVSGRGGEVRGLARDLVRMVRNLVDNAVAHAPAGSEVTLTLEATDARTLLWVRDAGPGVEAADREKIFEPFYRSRASLSRSDRGAGLGLGIAREIARAHGGDVELVHEPAGPAGAEEASFRITLPSWDAVGGSNDAGDEAEET